MFLSLYLMHGRDNKASHGIGYFQVLVHASKCDSCVHSPMWGGGSRVRALSSLGSGLKIRLPTVYSAYHPWIMEKYSKDFSYEKSITRQLQIYISKYKYCNYIMVWHFKVYSLFYNEMQIEFWSSCHYCVSPNTLCGTYWICYIRCFLVLFVVGFYYYYCCSKMHRVEVVYWPLIY